MDTVSWIKFTLLRFFILFLPAIIVPQSQAEITSHPSKKELSSRSLAQTFSCIATQELKRQNIPGAAYTIVQGKHILALETYGHLDINRTQKVTRHTIFRLASVSKPFAATLILMQANAGKLSLDDPISQYLPHFALAPPQAANKIQLHHLLSHSSGLMPNAYDNLLSENWDMTKITRRFAKLSPICPPGQCYGYQNVLYSMLQPVLEQVQSKPYDELLQTQIFIPLAMTDASVGFNAFQQTTNAAQPHILRIINPATAEIGRTQPHYDWRRVPVRHDFYRVAPAAGINASISDMAKWLIANLGYAPEILSPTLLTQLTQPRISTAKDLRRKYWRQHLTAADYGYGWRLYQFEGIKLVYHSGWVAGFRADIAYAPALDLGFAMLINAESNIINKLSANFWQLAINVRQSQGGDPLTSACKGGLKQ